MELLEYLVQAHNIRKDIDRSPAINNTNLDRFIKENLGNNKIYELTYSYKFHNEEFTDSIYIIAENENDPAISNEKDWYVNSDIYYNVSIQEKLFE